MPIAGSVPLKVVGHISSPKLNLPSNLGLAHGCHRLPRRATAGSEDHARLRQSMVQLASHTTSKAQSPVVAATTRATAMIVPIVIVQTPVRVPKGCLKSEVVGKRARMLIHLITGSQSHERCRDCLLLQSI